MFEHDINSAYGVCINYAFLNFTADLMNILQINNQMMILAVSFSLSVCGEVNFLQALMMASQYWEALKLSDALALNGMGYCENTITSSISFSVLATRNTRSSL